jgi:hypothetical protein
MKIWIVTGVLLTGLAAAAAPLAQEEPELFEDTPAESAPQAAPAAPAPRPPATPDRPPLKPLSSRLDFVRWQEMSERERQTFVEGAVATLAATAERLRQDLANDPRVPPERQAVIGQFIRDSTPRRAASAYLREMYYVYQSAEGQKLSMVECFQQAFRRLNNR